MQIGQDDIREAVTTGSGTDKHYICLLLLILHPKALVLASSKLLGISGFAPNMLTLSRRPPLSDSVSWKEQASLLNILKALQIILKCIDGTLN